VQKWAKRGQGPGHHLELRDSLYLGGDNYRSRSDRGDVVVQQYDELGEPAEPSQAELPTLIRIDTTARFATAISQALQALGLIMINRGP
jgi:hypothetical protein